MDNQVHTITKEWIHKHKTKRGGFTKAQIESLGLRYPPQAGWIQELTGKQISLIEARAFEAGKKQFSEIKGMRFKKVVSSLNSMTKQQLNEIDKIIKQLLNK